jgi:hypothetical protein
MRILFEIVIAWAVLSCTLGPCFCWLFFYGARQKLRERKLNRAALRFGSRLCISHPRPSPAVGCLGSTRQGFANLAKAL